MQLVVIKKGREVATKDEIEATAKAISDWYRKGTNIVVVSSGAIRMAENIIPCHGDDTPTLQTLAAVGQHRLMRAYDDAYWKHKQIVGQILLTREDVTEDDPHYRKRHQNTINTLEDHFRKRYLPVINENDTTSVEEIKFSDNDLLAAYVATTMKANLLILLTNVEGVYTRKSYLNGKNHIIPVVKPDEIGEVQRHCVKVERRNNTSNAMHSKVEAAGIAAKAGIAAIIANGTDYSTIDRLIKGEHLGTLFLPKTKTLYKRR